MLKTEKMQRYSKGNSKKIRKPIKSTLRKDDIHKRFQQQCLSRIRKDREKKIWEKRNLHNMNNDSMDEDELDYKKILKEEWDKFKLTYEFYGDLTEEEVENIQREMKNENDNIEREYMELLYYEEQMLENEIESYQNEDTIICPICENGILFENNQIGIIGCSQCSFELNNNYNLKSLGLRIKELQINHRNVCNYDLAFSYEPNIGVYCVCPHCGGMEVV